MYQRILHATDLESNHFNHCQQAYDISKKLNASFHLIHVINIPTSLYIAQTLGFAELQIPLRENVMLILKQVGDAFNLTDEQLHIAYGNVKHCVYDTIKQLGCDLLIIGSHSQKKFPSFLGSNAFSILQHAPCNIITLTSA
jgi:nucleotide-binding universal stress UspA family protein